MPYRPMNVASRLRQLYSRARVAGASGLTYLLRAEFNTDIAAPLPSPLAVDVGSLTVVDTNNKLSVSSGAAQFATGGATAGDPGVWGDQLARVAGRAVLAKLQGTSTASSMRVGWDSDQSGGLTDALAMVPSGNITAIANGTPAVLGGVSAATDYRAAVVQRGNGQLYAVKGGTEYPEWTLAWVSVEGTAAMYPAVVSGGASVSAAVDWLRVIDLTGGWESDYGIATQRLAGSVAHDTPYTHTANGIVEYIQTTIPTTSPTEVHFRRQGASDYWAVRVNSEASLQLVEVNGGAVSTRANAAGVVSAGHRIVVIFDGTTIRGYSNNTLRWTYSSAIAYATATAGRVNLATSDGVVSDLITWPRTISGAALAALNAASA